MRSDNLAAAHGTEYDTVIEAEPTTAGELQHLAVAIMQNELSSTTCRSVELMLANGASGPTLRMRKCRSYSKLKTQKIIPVALENQFGPERRVRVLADDPTAAGKKSVPSAAKQNCPVVEPSKVLATRTDQRRKVSVCQEIWDVMK